MASKAKEKIARGKVAQELKLHDEQAEKFRGLSLKIKNKEQMSTAEIEQFNDMTKNTKMERVLQTNEWVIDTLIKAKFEDLMYYEIFVARCRDIGEPITGMEHVTAVEKAKYFKDEINLLNKGNTNSIILYSMKLGNLAIGALCKNAKGRKVEAGLPQLDVINIADNAISDIGMHAVKSLVSANCCRSLNLASNMISESGLNMILKDLTTNTSLEALDLGVWKKSIRKNSIGFIGAKCIAAMLIHNRIISSLKMQDNDIGVKGADIISQALKQNKSLQHLKLSENNIQTEGKNKVTQGAEQIFKSNFSLVSLDLGKNAINAKIGTTLQYFISNSFKLQYLNLEHNNLQLKGIEFLTSVAIV